MSNRQQLIKTIAETIVFIHRTGILRVAVDGVDGAGKTTFADELAGALEQLGKTVIRASVDGFHNPRSIRYQRGRTSPDGFFLDSYDYTGLKQALLEPLSPSGSGNYVTAIFDHRTDSSILMPPQQAKEDSILVFDGIFLHRTELLDYWDFSIFLAVDFSISVPRGALRGPGFGSPDLEAPENRRYIDGQRRYLEECTPEQHATFVINNNDLSFPKLMWKKPWPSRIGARFFDHAL